MLKVYEPLDLVYVMAYMMIDPIIKIMWHMLYSYISILELAN